MSKGSNVNISNMCELKSCYLYFRGYAESAWDVDHKRQLLSIKGKVFPTSTLRVPVQTCSISLISWRPCLETWMNQNSRIWKPQALRPCAAEQADIEATEGPIPAEKIIRVELCETPACAHGIGP